VVSVLAVAAQSDPVIPAATVINQALQALRPPPRRKLSDWADEHFYLSAETAAEPGRWRTKAYQRGIMDALTDPRVERVAFLKSARVGATEMMKAFVGYHVHQDPCTILFVQPDEDSAKGFSKESIDPLIRDCPEIGALFTKSANGADSLLLKRFRGGVLQLAGARSPGNFRRVSRRVVIGDEIDAYVDSAGKEGDPLSLAVRRSEHFWNRKIFWASTPLIAGHSKIEQEFRKGDQRRFYVPCPHCGAMQVLRFSNLKWENRPPAEAVFVCIECGCEIEHEHKAAMVDSGEWRPGPHPQFPDDPPPDPQPGYVSFHIWAAYSSSPNASWGTIATEFVQATHEGPQNLKTFVNTVLGETWQERGEAPAWRLLYDRREAYEPGTCPDGVRFLTAAVDVQRNRLVWEVVGWGRGKESWSIDAGEIPGDTSDLTPAGPWKDVDALLDRTFDHARGAQLRIRMLAVDTSDQTQTCYNWLRLKEPGRVMAVKGNDSANVLVASPSKVDVALDGKPVGKLLLWRVGGPLAKSELYGWLKLQAPTDEEAAAGATCPPGYCHFPESLGEAYFRQLTAEQRVPRRTPQGYTTQVWEVIPGRENHYLDVRVYSRAAAAIVGLDRFRESDWQALERMLGELATKPPEHPASTTPAAAPAQPAPQQPPRKGTRRSAAWRPA
jgi:phage terminase large subunit GpA-like protein